MVRILILLTGYVLVGFLTGCSGCSKDSSTTTTAAGVAVPVTLVSITGDVLSTTGYNESRSVKPKFRSKALGVGPRTNACDSGTWSLQYVGGGDTVISTGTVTDGQFTIESVPEGKEGIVTFTCGAETQRCLVKAGNEGVLCNVTADAVIGAFEAALSPLTSAIFDGKSVAQIGNAIVEASKNDSTAADNLKADLENCKTDTTGDALKTCYKESIQASAFAGAFKIMQTMAGNWDVESLFILISDTLGYQIGVDSFIYSKFAEGMDTWFSTDFVAETRSFVADVVADQEDGGNAYPVKIVCVMHYSKYHAGGQFKYSPSMQTVNAVVQPSCKNDDYFAANGFDDDQIANINTAIDESADHGGGNSGIQLGDGSVLCTGGGGGPDSWNNPNFFCAWPPNMQIISKNIEVNRNDPTGEQRSNQEAQRVDMIRTFAEIDTALGNLESQTPPVGCLLGEMSDGPPEINLTDDACVAWFGNIMAPTKKYFAGLMGLYMYLDDPDSYSTGGSSKFSLAQLHTIFTHADFLGTRLAAWAPGYNGTSITVGEGEHTWQTWVPPVLAYANGIFTMQTIFDWSHSQAATQAQVEAAIAASSLPYSQTFAMFENIPTSDSIQSYIFGSSHHEEWNPYGAKFFNVPSVVQTGIPIYCKMTNSETGKAMESELNSNTVIECLDTTGITDNSIATGDDEGSFVLPDGFAYPYVLQERGWQGDDKGRLYVLADRKTGRTIRPGEQEVFIYEKKAGNTGSCSTDADLNSVVTAKIKYGWGDDTKEEAIKSYCMDMAPFMISAQFRFNYGGSVEISESDGNGNSWRYQVGQIGRVNADDPTSVMPICFYAAANQLVVSDQGIATVASGTLDSGTGEFSALGGGKVDLCSNSEDYSSYTQYYLVMMWQGSEGAAKTDLKAYFVKASGDMAKIRYRNWEDGDQYYESQLAYVKAAVLETALNAVEDGDGANLVAPTAAPSFTRWVKVLNIKHNAKFDPYCDDVTGPDGTANGYCDCYPKGTEAADQVVANMKDPMSCSLEDIAAEPTMSEPLYWAGENAAAYEAFFTEFGGMSGADLAGLDGSYMNTNHLYMRMEDAFQCAYKVTGETTYRKPQWVRWDGFYKSHDGCPASTGIITALSGDSGGGPVRLVNPKPMKNAYDVLYPNRMISLINYATKTVGQGITLESTDKVFSFDEALAMIALRNEMPPENFSVYAPGTTEASEGARLKQAFPFYQAIRAGKNDFDAVSAILRGLIEPTELE